MDNLARDAMLADQAGMSYGKWKAMHPNTTPKKEDVIPKGWGVCEFCGKPFKGGRRFCDIECRTKAYKDKAREIQKEYYKKRKLKMSVEREDDGKCKESGQKV
jgi:hypothetical protein